MTETVTFGSVRGYDNRKEVHVVSTRRATAFVFCLSMLLVGVTPAQDSLNCREVGYCDTPGYAYGVAVAGNYAYVADCDSGLRVISIADPAHPSEVGYCDTPDWALGVAVAGNYAYVADGGAGLRVISIADPAHPSEVGYYVTPGDAYGVAVAGNYAYVADFAAGLRVIEFYGGVGVEEGRQLTANSSRPTTTIARGDLHLSASGVKRGASSVLLDAAGRKVMELHAGANDVRRLAPGVYFVREAQAQAQAQARAIRKIVVTR